MENTSVSQEAQQLIEKHHLSGIFSSGLYDYLELHHFKAGEQIIESGCKVKYLYLALKGEAKVVPSSSSGKSSFLEYVLAPDIVGDMEYFTDSLYFHSVEAIDDCTYLAVPLSLIKAHYSGDTGFYRFICENMAAKMKRTSVRYSQTLLYPLKNRLADFILDLSERQASDQITIRTEDLAEYFAVTVRHLRRVLSELEQASVIERSKNQIRLMDREALKVLSELIH